MERTWDLDALYKDFESETYQNDIEQLKTLINDYTTYVNSNTENYDNFTLKLKEIIKMDEKLSLVARKLFAFASLTRSTDTFNKQANKYIAVLQNILSDATLPSTIVNKWIGNYPKLDEVIHSEEFSEFTFYLKSIKEDTNYLLSDDVEVLISKLSQSSSTAWSQLQSSLTSKLDVEITLNGVKKHMTLPEVRDLRQDPSQEVRKTAYEAELQSYEKINDAVAASLSSIKGEVLTISKMRGYSSPLSQTLRKSRMQKETLDAMLEAMNEYLPYFHQYMRRKGTLLNHENGIPFYDLNAPIGKISKKFSIEEAEEFIINNFKTFSDKLANLAKTAFEQNWIDVFPRSGKVGGAFCANIPPIKQSRILSNFTGNMRGVITLAHELGHAYHGDCIFDENILNTSYPMPLAETASTFCETIVMNAALETASEDDQLTLIEGVIQDYNAIIVDILSRYIFETEVFEQRKERPLSSQDFKDLMTDAQKKAYGDGVNHDYLHPYAWLNKPHYYSAGLNFYNFPYAFGLLFAKGLYAQYLKDKENFIPKYDKLLSATGKMTVEEVAKMADIDVTSVDFWRDSLEIIKKDIDTFLELTK
ncbi:M3 family oligoendopeptidase [Haloplasma contractile]|uniref:Oligoendopeptidase F protein n=1 Tax=Haloplasma contractile SSD-17B TaxID=1033810 RepID=U2FJI8_9MOLU|nr:M3 family oligoendopeptidase [Haloplasma contractile]ERJ12990.1 Oligoendopeptidase F putative protein [Haloplasma contractile SSD-17B]